MNIGITLGLTEDYESMWVNGIKLNVLNFAKTLMEIGDHNVWLLDTSNRVKDLKKVSWDYKKFKIFKFSEKSKDVDLLFMLGTSLPDTWIAELKKKNPNIKIIKYQCGNNYVIDMERSIFNDPKILPTWDGLHDETWFIPQQEYHNRDYYEIAYRHESDSVKVVPFIWDPEQLEFSMDIIRASGKKLPKYDSTKKRKDKKISVMEPNMNVLKYAMIPILIAEKVLRNVGKDAFKQIWIGSGLRILKNSYFKAMIKKLDLVNIKPNKIRFIDRYPIIMFLAEETDIILSHQWGNPLNYAYLDAMYFKYPIIHNAEFVKDGGYYYRGFEINNGAKWLDYVLENHDKNLEKYDEKNQKVLNRYLSTNPDIVDIYRKLIENIFSPGKHKMSHEYDWKTNLYKQL